MSTFIDWSEVADLITSQDPKVVKEISGLLLVLAGIGEELQRIADELEGTL